jgi:hypothetical protein
MDVLHIACAITAAADYFLTTDDEILKKAKHIQGHYCPVNIQIISTV